MDCRLMNMIAVVRSFQRGNVIIVTNVKKVHQENPLYFGTLAIYGLPEDLQRVDINHDNYKNIIHWCEK